MGLTWLCALIFKNELRFGFGGPRMAADESLAREKYPPDFMALAAVASGRVDSPATWALCR
jgi:hypothetical protein